MEPRWWSEYRLFFEALQRKCSLTGFRLASARMGRQSRRADPGPGPCREIGYCFAKPNHGCGFGFKSGGSGLKFRFIAASAEFVERFDIAPIRSADDDDALFAWIGCKNGDSRSAVGTGNDPARIPSCRGVVENRRKSAIAQLALSGEWNFPGLAGGGHGDHNV